MKQSFKDNCESFINMLLTRKSKRDLRKFDENKWYESAYSTVARPLGVMKRNQGGYKAWYSENYNKLKEMILDLLRRLTPNGTVDMNDEIEHIANECNVPFGVVQKIANIMIKYILCNYHGDKGAFDSAVVKANYTWVADEDFIKTLSIPVDSIVLKRAKREGADVELLGLKHRLQSTADLGVELIAKTTKSIKQKFCDLPMLAECFLSSTKWRFCGND